VEVVTTVALAVVLLAVRAAVVTAVKTVLE
jgi:hypothetical protein